jgi:hypothetical protein
MKCPKCKKNEAIHTTDSDLCELCYNKAHHAKDK